MLSFLCKLRSNRQALYRKAVATIEGVKSDPLFSYQPPVNLVALGIMFPASYILSPRWFHKVGLFVSGKPHDLMLVHPQLNVFMIRYIS
jgi:hypothetical protein